MTGSNSNDKALLEELCIHHGVPTTVLTELLDVEQELLGMGRRHGLYEKIGEILERATHKDK